MAENKYDNARQCVEKVLSEFLNSEEIDHVEYSFLSLNSTAKLIAHLKAVIKELDDESAGALDREEKVRFHLRAYLHSYRKSKVTGISEISMTEYEGTFEILNNKIYQSLLPFVYELFDRRFHMRAHYYFISNRAILKVLESVDLPLIEIISLCRPWMNSPRVLERLLEFDESELFSDQFVTYMKMAREFNCPRICEALIPIIPYGKFANFEKHEKDERKLVLKFSETYTIKLREDIAVAIDIIVPKKVRLKKKGEYIYFKSDLPYAQLAHYGCFWLGAIAKFRILTKEEREAILAETGSVKHLQVHFNISMKFWWAVKLLGVVSVDHVFISYSTLWYYFQNHGGAQDDGKYDEVVWNDMEGKYVPIENCGYRVRGLKDDTKKSQTILASGLM